MNKEQEQSKEIKEQAQESQAELKRKPSAWKRFFGKKWVFPAIYVAAAALILSVMWMIQDPNNYALTGKDLGIQVNEQTGNDKSSTTSETNPQDAVTVTSPIETMKWPVPDNVKVDKVMGFFDQAAGDKERQAAMVEFEDRFWPHQGVDFAKSDGTTFDVTAALGGKVTRVVDDPMVGSLVEISHQDGLTSVYQSLSDVKVSVGDEVHQGDVIAKAGRNLFERNEGIHLHFGVMKDGLSLSPESYILKNETVNTDDANAEADADSGANAQTQNQP